MKATGIVRRIDDLGRVVIPKEIRRTLRIREGDPLEIFTDREGEVILKKYSHIGELGTLAKQYSESLAQIMECTVCIVAAAGNGKKELQDKYISKDLERALEQREQIFANANSSKFIKVADGTSDYREEAVCPILCEGDVIGSVIFLSRDEKRNLGETERKVALSAAGFLGRQMEQ